MTMDVDKDDLEGERLEESCQGNENKAMFLLANGAHGNRRNGISA